MQELHEEVYDYKSSVPMRETIADVDAIIPFMVSRSILYFLNPLNIFISFQVDIIRASRRSQREGKVWFAFCWMIHTHNLVLYADTSFASSHFQATDISMYTIVIIHKLIVALRM